MSETVLDINNLSVSLSRKGIIPKMLLDDISFSVPARKVTGIAGESGSGKTLIALSILRLLPPNINIVSGSILFSDAVQQVDTTSISADELKKIRGNRISMIFQEPMTSLNPSLKCGFQVKEAVLAHKDIGQDEAYEKVIHLFSEVKLPRPYDIYHSYPHQLSGGQKQRVMISMALSADPDILIADEPTTALDVTVQKKILELLRETMDNHKLSIIFITHDLRLLKEFSDYNVILREGKIVEKGSREKIFTFPKFPYTKGLIACLPPLTYKPERLLTVSDYEKGLFSLPLEKTPVVDEKRNPEEKPVLSIQDLSVYFNKSLSLFHQSKKKITAVDTLSLDVFKGETVGIVGESGCGKTSLGRAILHLLPAGSGTIIYKGEDINRLKGKGLINFRKKVQIVFQDPYSSLNPVWNIIDTLTEPVKVHMKHLNRKQQKDRAVKILERVGLPADSLFRYPHQFSGGQRQRIGIARCLVLEPELIILDEAVSALDVSVQAQILNLLNDIKNDLGLTYIFISHDMAVVKYMSDRLVVMKDGKIEETGSSFDIYSKPVSEYTKKLIHAIPGKI